MRSGFTLLALGLASLVAAKDGRRDPAYGDGSYGYGHSNSGGASGSSSAPASTTTSVTSSGTSANSSSVLTATADLSLMSISAVMNDTTVQYTMTSKSSSVGWMAIGFGTQMAGSPMVIMWPNSDGTITISQRSASGEAMPTLVSNPPRVAAVDAAASDLTASQPTLSFTIPVDDSSSTSQNLIWAFASSAPGSSSQSAPLQQHDDSGAISLSFSSDPNAAPSSGALDIPLLPYQKMIVAHAILCTIGFLILLPAGALLARYARTFTGGWFKGHWVFQLAIAGPIIVTGVALGIAAVSSAQAMHLDDDHKKWGVAIFVLYFVQCMVGEVIHRVKPTSWTVRKKRPLQNYFHAILGLLVIGLSFYQVRTGYRVEWVKTTSRPAISNAANIVWLIWVVLIPVLYFAGLAFLPKQLRQERPQVDKREPDEYALRNGYSDEPRFADSR